MSIVDKMNVFGILLIIIDRDGNKVKQSQVCNERKVESYYFFPQYILLVSQLERSSSCFFSMAIYLKYPVIRYFVIYHDYMTEL